MINNGLSHILASLSNIRYKSYEHVQPMAKVTLHFNNNKETYTKIFKDIINLVKKYKNNFKSKEKISIKLIENNTIIYEKHKTKEDVNVSHIKTDNIKNKIQIGLNIINSKFLEIIQDDLFQISILNRKEDAYSQLFFIAINEELSIFSDKEMKLYLKNIKYKVIERFYLRNIYKNLDYSPKDFKKNRLDEVFANNLNVPLNMLRIYGDVFNINLVYIDITGSFKFITFYDIKKATVIITEDKYRMYTLKSKTAAFIRGSAFNQYICDKLNYTKTQLETFNISSLQNICKFRGIYYKKSGKTKRINKTKNELIYELCNLSV